MSNNQTPYDDFFAESKENDQETPKASEELEQVDRGAPEIKVERKGGVNKNMVIAGVVVAIALLVVVVFITALVKRLGGGGEEEVVAVENLTLQRGETQTLSNLQNKIAAEDAKREELARLERERLAREARERAERERLANQKGKPVLPTPAPKPEPVAAAPQAPALGPKHAAPVPLSQKKPDELTPEEAAILRKRAGEVLAWDSGPAAQRDSGQSTLNRPNDLGNMLITERHANGVAMVRHSRKFLLMRGSNIPCTIIPRVITNYLSQPTCVVNEDVYSPEGIVLIDRGSKVFGEQRIAMQQGVKRVFIAWADIETPEGVSIKIDSMAADALGGSGIDAWIDNHYKERFGAAIFLSFMDDLFEIIAAEAGKNEYNFENSTDNASSMAQIALESSINIKPTGYIMPARQTNIIVARDVDFTDIYKTR